MQVFQTAINVREGQSGVLVMTLRDENGDLVETAALDSVTLDLYRWHNGASDTINGREQLDVLNANGGAYFDTIQSMLDEDGNDQPYNFRFDYVPADVPFFGEDTGKHQTEVHIAHFRFTWNGGAGSMAHEFKMTVTNFRRFPVETT
jgi:hypothetical protein